MSGEKTEKPTPKRRKESRREGQVARTQELGAWSSMLLFGLAARGLVTHELSALQLLMRRALRLTATPDPAKAVDLLGDALLHAMLTVLALAAGVLVVGVLGAVSQGGFYLATKAAKPSFKKLNPISGVKRMFGPHALWEGAKMLAKCSVVALVVVGAVKGLVPLVGGLVPPETVMALGADKITSMMRNVAVAGLVMAGADYAFQRRRVGKQTRMSKDEIRQEHRQSEGDPHVKSAIRSRQLAMARSRMMAAIAEADVVLVNPTHVAVALRYAPEAGAPTVVAKGAGAVATKIRERAAEHGVPLVQDIPLARALYRSCQVGQSIPAELFAAVAQVLAFVISRRSKGRSGGEHRSPRRETTLPEVARGGRHRRRSTRPTPAVA